MRKPKNYGQKPLPGVEEHIEEEAAKNELPKGMPALGLVITYALGLGLTARDAEEIYDRWLLDGFRTKNGTGALMKDWKAAVRIWNRNGFFPSQREAKKAMEKLTAEEAKQKAAIRRMKGGY